TSCHGRSGGFLRTHSSANVPDCWRIRATTQGDHAGTAILHAARAADAARARARARLGLPGAGSAAAAATAVERAPARAVVCHVRTVRHGGRARRRPSDIAGRPLAERVAPAPRSEPATAAA